MKRLLLAVPLALALAAPAARAQAPNQPENGSPERAYSLDDALHLVRNDPKLQSSEQDVIIAESRVTEAELRFLPEVGLQASASKFNALYPFALPDTYHNILLFPNTPENIYSGRGYFNLPIYEGQLTLKGISEGVIISTVVQQPFEFGYQSMIDLDKVLRGDKSFMPADGKIIVPTRVIDKTNVADFIGTMKQLLAKQ